MSDSRGKALRGLACLLLAGTLSALAVAPKAEARPLVTGVSNLYSSAPLAFKRVRQSGATAVRIPLHWAGTLPDQRPQDWDPEDPADPHYDWSASDREVTRAVNAGLMPVLGVGGPPSWAQRCQAPPSLPFAECDPDPVALRAFATAAAQRYAGTVPGIPAVRYWQALNEPNLSNFFFPQYATDGRALSPALYRHLLNAFYDGVKTSSPSNLVLSAGLGPIERKPWTIGPMRFARELLCMRSNSRPRAGNCGGGVHFDIFAIQPYTTGGPTHRGGANDVQLGDLDKLRTLLGAAERAGRIKSAFKRAPLWITELSWDSKPPDPGGLPMHILTRWTAEALHTAWRAGVARFFWYSLRDSAREPGVPFSQSLESGLYFRGPTLAKDRPKPVLQAFRFPFVAYPIGKKLHFWGRTPGAGGGKVRIQLRQNGRWRTIRTIGASKAGIFRGAVRTGYGRGGQGAARAAYRRHRAAPFSMAPVKDFYHPPFGQP